MRTLLTVLAAGAGWLAAATGLGILVGRAIRLRDDVLTSEAERADDAYNPLAD